MKNRQEEERRTMLNQSKALILKFDEQSIHTTERERTTSSDKEEKVHATTRIAV